MTQKVANRIKAKMDEPDVAPEFEETELNDAYNACLESVLAFQSLHLKDR